MLRPKKEMKSKPCVQSESGARRGFFFGRGLGGAIVLTGGWCVGSAVWGTMGLPMFFSPRSELSLPPNKLFENEVGRCRRFSLVEWRKRVRVERVGRERDIETKFLFLAAVAVAVVLFLFCFFACVEFVQRVYLFSSRPTL